MLSNAGLYNRASHAQNPRAAIDAAYARKDWKSLIQTNWSTERGMQLLNLGTICNAESWSQIAGEMRKDYPL